MDEKNRSQAVQIDKPASSAPVENGAGGMAVISGKVISDRSIVQNLKEKVIPVTELCAELIAELDRKGYMARLRKLPQYGTRHVPRPMNHTRYDYVVQQIDAHCTARELLKSNMAYSYNNTILKIGGRSISFLDAAMIMTIVLNIGHFQTTFVGSQAALRLCIENSALHDLLISGSEDERFTNAVREVLINEVNSRFHVLNAIVLLESCNKELCSVKAAKELLFMYLGQPNRINEEKKEYFLSLYRHIRDIVYLQNDLLFSPIPVRILNDRHSRGTLMTELLSKYNDQSVIVQIINSLKKTLDDGVYCTPENIFREEELAAGMIRRMKKDMKNHSEVFIAESWPDYVLSEHSPFNTIDQYRQKAAVDLPLKLTFQSREVCMVLRAEFERMEHVACAGYNRKNGVTLLTAVRKKYERPDLAAFRVLQKVISVGQRYKKDINISHFILTVRFFLENLFGKEVEICCSEDCGDMPLLTYGSRQRIERLKKAIDRNYGSDDRKHEIEALLNYLSGDKVNDTAMILPCDIRIWNRAEKKQEKEFDGMIIFPNRRNGQIVFMEAKNRKDKPSRAGNELADKLTYLHIPFDRERIKTIGFDAFYSFTFVK